MHRAWTTCLLAGWLLLVGCGGARDAHDVASDFEGVVGATTSERLLRDVDLGRSPLVVSVAGEEDRRFGPEDQQALTDYLRDALRDLEGDQVTIVQEVSDETATSATVTLTLKVRHEGSERFVPVVLEVSRAGRRPALTRVRVMLARR